MDFLEWAMLLGGGVGAIHDWAMQTQANEENRDLWEQGMEMLGALESMYMGTPQAGQYHPRTGEKAPEGKIYVSTPDGGSTVVLKKGQEQDFLAKHPEYQMSAGPEPGTAGWDAAVEAGMPAGIPGLSQEIIDAVGARAAELPGEWAAAMRPVLSGYGTLSGDMADRYGGIIQRLGGQYEALGEDLAGGYGELQTSIGQGYGDLGTDITGRYGDLRSLIGTGIEDIIGDVTGGYGELQRSTQEAWGGLTSDVLNRIGQLTEDVSGRYGGLERELTGGYEARLGRARELLEGMGGQERRDIAQAYRELESQQLSNLASQGLTGTTIAPSLQAGVARERTDALARLEERLRGETLGWEMDLMGEQLAMQEKLGIGELESYIGNMQTYIDTMYQMGAQGVQMSRQDQQNLMNAQQALKLAKLDAQQAIGMSEIGTMQNIGLSQLAQQTGVGLTELGMQQQLGQQRIGSEQQVGMQEAAAHQQTGLAELLARQQIASQGFGIEQQGFQDYISAISQWGMAPYEAAMQTTMPQLDWLTQMTTVPGFSPLSAISEIAGNYLAMTNVPEQQTDWLGPFASMAAPAVGWGSKAMFGVCVDALAKVETPEGYIPLAEIARGDKVLVTDGQWAEVVDTDVGLTDLSREHHFIEIKTANESIVLTIDHVLDDRPAGEIKVRDIVRTLDGPKEVVEIKKANIRPSGDLKLAGATEYYANGFVVRSMYASAEVL